MGRIAAKRRSEQWSKILEENHQKLTFREGVQPWDLASCSRRIESYRFIMESSNPGHILQVRVSWHGGKLAVALSTECLTEIHQKLAFHHGGYLRRVNSHDERAGLIQVQHTRE